MRMYGSLLEVPHLVVMNTVHASTMLVVQDNDRLSPIQDSVLIFVVVPHSVRCGDSSFSWVVPRK